MSWENSNASIQITSSQLLMLKKCGSRAVIVVRTSASIVHTERPYSTFEFFFFAYTQISAVVQSSTELVTVSHESPYVG